MKIFIDTSFVIATTNARDRHYRKARELAASLKTMQFLTTEVVLIEIGNSFARGFREDATAIINEFLNSENVEVVRLTQDLFEKAFGLYQSHRDKDWGLGDCISFVAMRQAGVQDALTHDHHFVQAGFHALMRETA